MVVNTDREPVLDPINDRSVNENTTLEFTTTANDPDGDEVSYSVNDLPPGATFSSSGDFSWTPGYGMSGSYNVEFTASSNGLDDSETITIYVGDVDRPPVLDSIGDKTVNENSYIEFTISAADPDADDVILYSIEGKPEDADFYPETRQFTWTPDYNDSGSYDVKFIASSNDFNDSENITITVLNVDRPVELDPVDDVTISESEIINFMLIGNDPDDDDITYSASNLPGNSSLDYESGEFTWVTGYNDSGDYNVNFSAVSNGLTDYENVSIHVLNVNVPPVFLSVSPRTVQVSRNLQFNLNATDIDDDPLTYSADSLPDGAGFNTTNLLFNWTPLVNQTGIHYANFTVNDSQYYDYLNVSITVTNATTSAVTVSSAAGGGGGGGGGGGTTGEEFENIAVKDASSVFVGTGPVIFEFNRDGDDIEYVGYDSLKNAGTISVTIEVLLDKSTFVSSLPSGVVYKNINIWVGKTGYAIEENIDDPYIGFRVDRDWIEGNNIDPDSITLNRYDGGWGKLSTWQTDSDDNCLYFEASTPGFSPFAITGETQATGTNNDVSDTQFSPADSELESNVTAKETEPENILNGFSGLISCLILTFVCFLYRKQ
jgi:PGF-pre-PGF domain-containing protein